jgi:hypothetical protein
MLMNVLNEIMRNHLGMVVPVWFPQDSNTVQVTDLLRATLKDCPRFVDWSNVLVAIDGAPWATNLARELADEFQTESGGSFRILELPENGGKGLTVASGFEELLKNHDITHFCVRDDDNDHSIFDLPHLVRLHLQIQNEENTDQVMVVGVRPDIARPMGFWRGEFELLHNACLWECTKFVLAREGRIINTQWISGRSQIPDLESGYKIYSRAAAELLISSIRKASNQYGEMRMGHFGVETVPALEILLNGGIIGQGRRTAYDRQPLSTFAAGTKLPRLYANQAIYVFKRLEVAADIALQVLNNAIPDSQLSRSPEGRSLLEEYRINIVQDMGWNKEEAMRNISVPEFV